MALHNFLGDLADRQLRQITIPGSHDAGIVKDHIDPLSRLGSGGANVATQHESLGGAGNEGFALFRYPGDECPW